MRDEPADGEAELRYPIRVTFGGCCASAVKQSAKNRAPSARVKIFSFIVVPVPPYALRLSDHFIRPRQHVGWNRHADLLRGLEVDDELKLCRLLHRQVGWFGSL